VPYKYNLNNYIAINSVSVTSSDKITTHSFTNQPNC
jgi:hypothetical protein